MFSHLKVFTEKLDNYCTFLSKLVFESFESPKPSESPKNSFLFHKEFRKPMETITFFERLHMS